MIELGCPVVVDGDRRGFVVGRTFDLKRQAIVYDVRLSGTKVLLHLDAANLTFAGSCQRNVIGRGILHNPGRARFFAASGKQRST